tara:strand:- start:569 stop:1015 length:447 start_codon:yes stop_codon:yes gene_type:complete
MDNTKNAQAGANLLTDPSIWSNVDTNDRIELGTVYQGVGKDGWIELSQPNMQKTDGTRCVVFLYKNEDERAMVYCSPAVSEGLRNKTISIPQLYNFNLYEAFTQDGTAFLQIQMPSGGQRIAFKASEYANANATFEQEVVDPSTLVAF